VADEGDLAQVQGLQERIQISREGVVVISGGRLAGLAEPATVVGDEPAAVIQQDPQLLVPGAAAERVAMDQDDRRSRAVVLVVQADRRSSPGLA
jgi:hypothetical protein